MSGSAVLAAASAGVVAVAVSRQRRTVRNRTVVAALSLAVLVLFALTLSCGQGCTPPSEVVAVLAGREVAGASFIVGDLRLPRALLSVVTGLAFGFGGVAFQIMLRNPLASPDIIGISSGASAAAVFAIVILGLDGAAVSAVAVTAGLAVAVATWPLSTGRNAAGAQLILVGIGISAMLDSLIAYILLEAPAWDRQDALRWLTGSVNNAGMTAILITLAALAIFGAVLLAKAGDLEALRMGDDMARALGVNADTTRLVVTVAAVGLVAFATAASGPIAFVAFLAGPIAVRLTGGAGGLLIPAALIGAVLVLGGDYAGQFLLPSRLPVGVVTGALGAPFLLYLIARANRNGGQL